MNSILLAVVPILVAALTIAGGIFSYARQKAADRYSELIRVQQEHYRSYLFAMQRVLTSCVRTDQSARRLAIDDFRSFEAALYVAAPEPVAKHLSSLHEAFFDYTRCIRCTYEEMHFKKFGDTQGPERLKELEAVFLDSYRKIVRSMRKHTLGDDGDIVVELSLASKEA